MSNRISSRLSVEALEDRRLMAASLAAHVAPVGLAAHVGAPASPVVKIDYGTALKSQAAVQMNSAFSIMNNTNYNLTFNIRWQNTNGSWTGWQPYTLSAHYRGEYWYGSVGYTSGCFYSGPTGLNAQIWIPTNTHGGTKTYTLYSSPISGRPAIGAGLHYQFKATSSTTMDLYTGG